MTVSSNYCGEGFTKIAIVTAITFIGAFLFGRSTIATLATPRFPKNEYEPSTPSTSFSVVASQRQLCDLSKGPIPIVHVTSGRSGSSAIFDVITNLTGFHCVTREVPSGHPHEVREQLLQWSSGDWLHEALCKQQVMYPKSKVVGIKWRPQEVAYMLTDGALEALAFIRDHPIVKVVRTRRNPLDVRISVEKHFLSHGELKSHCFVDDEECIKSLTDAGTNIKINTKRIESDILDLIDKEDGVDHLLQLFDIPFVNASYDDLFYPEDGGADEWMRIFNFIGAGPTESLSMEDVLSSGSMAVTASRNHNETIANYWAVRKTLQEAKLDYLLH